MYRSRRRSRSCNHLVLESFAPRMATARLGQRPALGRAESPRKTARASGDPGWADFWGLATPRFDHCSCGTPRGRCSPSSARRPRGIPARRAHDPRAPRRSRADRFTVTAAARRRPGAPGPEAGGSAKKAVPHVAREAAAAQGEDVAVQPIVHVVARNARGEADLRHGSARREGSPGTEKRHRSLDPPAQRGRGGAGDCDSTEMPLVVENERHLRACSPPRRAPPSRLGPRSRPGETRA